MVDELEPALFEVEAKGPCLHAVELYKPFTWQRPRANSFFPSWPRKCSRAQHEQLRRVKKSQAAYLYAATGETKTAKLGKQLRPDTRFFRVGVRAEGVFKQSSPPRHSYSNPKAFRFICPTKVISAPPAR